MKYGFSLTIDEVSILLSFFAGNRVKYDYLAHLNKLRESKEAVKLDVEAALTDTIDDFDFWYEKKHKKNLNQHDKFALINLLLKTLDVENDALFQSMYTGMIKHIDYILKAMQKESSSKRITYEDGEIFDMDINIKN